jgi:flagellar basal-body rod protein FlgG
MANGIYSALSGAIGRVRAMDVIANDMANIGTTGYKGTRVTFKEMLAEADGIVNLTHRQVRLDSVDTDFSPGGLKTTGNVLDVAIMGEGFFELETPEGPRFTRAGAFTVDSTGQITNLEGYPVMGDGGPISVPPDKAVRVIQNGVVVAGDLELGKLKVVEFADRSTLERSGHNLWTVDEQADRQIVEEVLVQPGAVERSNVSPVKAMTELIRVSRHYESLLRAVDTFSQADKRTVSELGK